MRGKVEPQQDHVLSLIPKVGMAVPSSGRRLNSGARSQGQSADHPAQVNTCLSDDGRSPVHQLKLADPIMLVVDLVGSNVHYNVTPRRSVRLHKVALVAST